MTDIASSLRRTSPSSTSLSPPPSERHRLLPSVDLGESLTSRRHFDDDEWDDVYALVPVVVILLAVCAVALLLWPVVSFDGGVEIAVAGLQSHLVRIATKDFDFVAVSAAFLDLHEPTHANTPLFETANVHVFYNSPPAVVPANESIHRNIDQLRLSNHGREFAFSAFRWELVEGSNVTVNWRFDEHVGGRPDFLVLRSKTAFDLWRQDAYPPLNFQIHTEYSTQQGTYTFSNHPTDVYYFLFSAPTYFWPGFEALGNVSYDISPMRYDASGTNPSTPQPVVSCAMMLKPPGSFAAPPSPSLLNNLYTAFTSLFPYTPTPSQNLTTETNTPIIVPPSAQCQIPTPSPQYISQLFLLLESPDTPLPGGPARGNHGSMEGSDSGTLDAHTVEFALSPRLRPGVGPSVIVFFLWAFCAVIALSVCVATVLFCVLYVMGVGILWVRRWFGWEEEGGSDGEDGGEEALPVYRAEGEAEGVGRGLPGYSEADPLVVGLGVESGGRESEEARSGESVYEVAREDGGGEEGVHVRGCEGGDDSRDSVPGRRSPEVQNEEQDEDDGEEEYHPFRQRSGDDGDV
ncbi:hypothetical protein HDU98_000033 [Podochytrium sp. JEL0797]|nr:hypothetical protein HDU98_000033 [Podochytrium sp. JEL0797]